MTYSLSKGLVLIHIYNVVAIQLLLIRSVFSLNITNEYLHHKCIESQGKYQPGSEYEKNLNEIIRSTSTENFRRGYASKTNGEGPNSVTFLYQCRGDSYGPKCRSCYATALAGLRRRCPGNKGSVIWYDQCLMEISPISTDAQIDYDNIICMANAKNVSGNQQLFRQEVAYFLDKLNLKATNKKNMDGNRQAVLYAAGEERVGTKTMYGMVQCSKDLWLKGCDGCLEYIIMKESNCCAGKQGGRVFSTSCTFRYEFYPFLQK